jgi:hypothetical protein
MKKDLDQIQKDLAPIRQQLEALRLKWLKKLRGAQALMAVPILLFIGAVAGMLFLPSFYFYFVLLMVLAAILLAVIYMQLVTKPVDKYRSEFKSMLLEKIVHELYPHMTYQPTAFIPKKDFYASHIFHGKADEGYQGEDYFEGVINKVPVRFSEVTAHQLSGKNTTVLFSGIFMILDVKKEFKGNTFVLPDNFEKILGQVALTVQEVLHRLKGELVYLKDNPDFERKFAIFSTDKEEALEILTNEMLDSILWIRDQFNSEISIAFQDGYVYIAIPLNHRHLFEANINKSLVKDEQLLERIYAELGTCLELIDHLPLQHLHE